MTEIGLPVKFLFVPNGQKECKSDPKSGSKIEFFKYSRKSFFVGSNKNERTYNLQFS